MSIDEINSDEMINPSAEFIYVITLNEHNQIMSLDINSWSPIAGRDQGILSGGKAQEIEFPI
jgi:hypothetical protein